MSKEERKDFYRSVAWGLNRPLFAVYRRVLRMYDNRNHVGKSVQGYTKDKAFYDVPEFSCVLLFLLNEECIVVHLGLYLPHLPQSDFT